MITFLRSSLSLVLGALALGPASAQDGLYADFATSQGNFTCQLAFQTAPRTVANFVGLAADERAWLDLPSGAANKRAFYNGLTFHRVVSGFVIQGGSPNGNGTDGPGYTFRDEFNATLRHSKAGILSMANSGPHSNGSQFFITLAATSHLDDVHSVFGEVTSGMDVVNAIGSVAVDANGKPLTPVVINSVTIRRVGAAASAFDVSSQGLPVVGGAAPRLTKTGGNFSLQFPRALYSEYWLYDSPNLLIWARQRIGLYVTAPPSGDLDVTASAIGQPNHFYRVPEIAYPGPIFTPASLAGTELRLNLTSGETVTFAFNNAGGGTSAYNDGQTTTNGTIQRFTWTQEAYRGQLYCESTNLVPLMINDVFTSSFAGTFKGTAYTQAGAVPISGTSTFTPSPIAAASARVLRSIRVKATRSSQGVTSAAARK